MYKAALYPRVNPRLAEITTVVRQPGIITSPDYPFHYSSGELWCWKIFFNSSVTINLILYNISFNQNQVLSIYIVRYTHDPFHSITFAIATCLFANEGSNPSAAKTVRGEIISRSLPTSTDSRRAVPGKSMCM